MALVLTLLLSCVAVPPYRGAPEGQVCEEIDRPDDCERRWQCCSPGRCRLEEAGGDSWPCDGDDCSEAARLATAECRQEA